MKSYNHLFEKLISEENIESAIHNASKGKHWKERISKLDSKDLINRYQKLALCYRNSYHKPKQIYDGVKRKKRWIICPTVDEQIMHHMVVNVLKPIFLKSMYYHSYGSIPKKGSHLAKKHIEKWLRNDIENTKWCLQMDIKKYFENIPHDILMNKLSEKIHDEKFLRLLNEIIRVQYKGIPLGFYTSQWFANFYLTDLDHFIKEVLGIKYYVRYMDDMVILDGNKKYLHKVRKEIELYLNENLGLELKDNWQIFKIQFRNVRTGKEVGRKLDFMGFKFHRSKTILRRSIMLRVSKKSRKIFKNNKLTIFECRQMLSYIGWLSSTNTYNMYLKWIKPFVSIRKLKQRISAYDRRNAKCGKKSNLRLCQVT